MIYYKNTNGEVFAYETEQEREQFGAADLVRMTDADLNPAPIPLTKDQVEAQRLRAYVDPIKGSDRLFVEAQRMQMMGEEGWEVVRDRAAARYQEIQELYPWP